MNYPEPFYCHSSGKNITKALIHSVIDPKNYSIMSFKIRLLSFYCRNAIQAENVPLPESNPIPSFSLFQNLML